MNREVIDRLKKLEQIVEDNIGKVLTEGVATDIYQISNEIMCKKTLPNEFRFKDAMYDGMENISNEKCYQIAWEDCEKWLRTIYKQ